MRGERATDGRRGAFWAGRRRQFCRFACGSTPAFGRVEVGDALLGNLGLSAQAGICRAFGALRRRDL